MNVYQRSAIVAAVLFLGLAVWAAFVPTHSHATSCGTWVSPGLTDGEVADAIDRGQAAIEDSGGLGDPTNLQAAMINLVETKKVCDSKLSTRQTLTWVGVAGALVVPAGILFIASGRRRREPDLVDD